MKIYIQVRAWKKMFSSLKVKCAEMTGDIRDIRLQDMDLIDIVLCTAEKLDAMTRWNRNRFSMADCLQGRRFSVDSSSTSFDTDFGVWTPPVLLSFKKPSS